MKRIFETTLNLVIGFAFAYLLVALVVSVVVMGVKQ
jgi:hypothetical protein